MKNIFFLMIIVFTSIFSFNKLIAYQNIEELIILNRNYINLEYQRYSSSSFYDFSRNPLFTILDSIDQFHEKEYSYEVQKNIVEFSISQTLYSTNKSNYYLNLSVPFSINSYEKIYKSLYDTIPDIHNLYDDLNVPYLKLKAGVDFKINNIYLLGSIIYNHSMIKKEKFQIFDTYFSNLISEASFIYDTKKSYFNLDLAYKTYFSSQISDEFIGRFNVGLTTVESSVLRAFLEYSRSITPINTEIEYQPEVYQLQSENIKVGLEFKLLMDSGIMPILGYEIIMSGINNSIYGMFHIGLNYVIKIF